MYFQGLALILSCFLPISMAAVAIEIVQGHPDYPDHCLDPRNGLLHRVGSSWPMDNGVCGIVECVRNYDSQLLYSYATCGVVSLHGSSCRLEEDLSLPYPHCCPRPVCHFEDVNNSEGNNNGADDSKEESDSKEEEELIVNYDVTLDDDLDWDKDSEERDESSDALAEFVAWLFRSHSAINEVEPRSELV